jgi:hypothetical protein
MCHYGERRCGHMCNDVFCNSDGHPAGKCPAEEQGEMHQVHMHMHGTCMAHAWATGQDALIAFHAGLLSQAWGIGWQVTHCAGRCPNSLNQLRMNERSKSSSSDSLLTCSNPAGMSTERSAICSRRTGRDRHQM